jgi:hypothetical protein
MALPPFLSKGAASAPQSAILLTRGAGAASPANEAEPSPFGALTAVARLTIVPAAEIVRLRLAGRAFRRRRQVREF